MIFKVNQFTFTNTNKRVQTEIYLLVDIFYCCTQSTLKRNIQLKNKLNIFLLVGFLLALVLTIWVYYQTTNRIGDITFDKDIDNSEFKICNEDRIPQYYAVGTNYQNGEKAIKKELSELINNLNFKNSGFITYRFIVNCKGEVGSFRVKTIDSVLKENVFDSQKIKQLQKSIEKLKQWNAGKRKDETLDSYYVLNFKIQNNKITDIF